MDYNWQQMLDEATRLREQQIPIYLKQLAQQKAEELENVKSMLGQRGLLGSAYGQAALGNISARQQAQTQQYLNQLGLQDVQQRMNVAQFLARLEQMEKARQFQEAMWEKQRKWQEQMMEANKPKWYDYLLALVPAAATIGAAALTGGAGAAVGAGIGAAANAGR
jgi:uncharacterized protein YfaS (alpha-2-macroglobulin family)